MENIEMNETKGSSLRDYLRIFFKYKYMIATIVAAAMITVHIGLEMRTPAFEANVKMYISGMKKIEAEHYRGIVAGSIAGGHSQLVQSSAVVERVVDALQLYNRPLDYEKKFASKMKAALIDYEYKDIIQELESLPEEERRARYFQNSVDVLKSNVGVVSSDDSAVFTITVTDFNPYQAILIANAISRSYVIFDLEQQVLEYELEYGEKNIKVLQVKNYIEEFKKYLDGKLMPNIEAVGPASVKIIEQARSIRSVIYKPAKSVARILAFVLSFTLGLLLAFGLNMLSGTIQSPQDITEYMKINFLGSVPKIRSKRKKLINILNPENSRYEQSWESLSHQIYVTMKDQNKKIALIADAEGSQDTSYLVANMGLCLSNDSSNRILIIDANLRKPSLHEILNISNNPGLSEIIRGEADFESAVTAVRENFFVITTGRLAANPLSVLQTTAMADLVKNSKDAFNLVFIIGADLNGSSDSIVLTSYVDGFILVVNEGKVKRQVLKRVMASFEEKENEIIGAVINNRKHVIPELIYRRA